MRACSVSVLGTQPIRPELGERGMTAYRAMLRSLSAVVLSLASMLLTNPNSCITRSSCRRSSCPYTSVGVLRQEGFQSINLEVCVVRDLFVSLQKTGLSSLLPVTAQFRQKVCWLSLTDQQAAQVHSYQAKHI